jgi:hypothetical protein
MANVPAQKKCQDFINAGAVEIQLIRASVARMKAMRTLFQSVNPATTGTALNGNTAALSTALNSLDTAAGSAIWDTLIAAYVPSHQGNSL